MIKRVLLVLAAVIVVLVIAEIFSAGRACAHDPRFACSPRSESNPIVISDATKSWAFYGRLAGDQEDHYVVTTASGAQRIPMSILVDVRDAANPARPRATLYDQSGRTLASVDLANAQPFYEPFSRVRYLTSPERLVDLGAGTFTIVIAMQHGGAAQRYTFAFGRDERFGVLEIPYLLGAIYRVHNRRF